MIKIKRAFKWTKWMECAASSRSVGVSLGPPFTWSLSPMKRGSATYQPAKRLLTLLLLLDRTAYANEPLSPTGCDPLRAISCFVRCPPVPHHLLRHKSWVIHSPGCCCCCSLKLRRNLIEFESKWMKRAAVFSLERDTQVKMRRAQWMGRVKGLGGRFHARHVITGSLNEFICREEIWRARHGHWIRSIRRFAFFWKNWKLRNLDKFWLNFDEFLWNFWNFREISVIFS